jgi:hypothetical protein
MKLIDKDALVAEIERRLEKLYEFLPDASKVEKGMITISEACNTGKYTALESFENYIDTLEVKEVDLEKYYHDFLQKEWFDKNCSRTMSEMMAFTAKHFFELGLRASQSTVSVYGIEEALKENGIDPDSKEADMYREAIYKIYDRLKAQKG